MRELKKGEGRHGQEFIAEFNFKREFGVEIEVSRHSDTTKRELAEALAEAVPEHKVSWGAYHHQPEENDFRTEGRITGRTRTEGYIKVEDDSSCGFEVVTPVLKGWRGIAKLKTIAETIQEQGGKINSNCGLHIHRDVNDLELGDIQNIVKFYAKYEPAIDQVLPSSRRKSKNDYCQSFRILHNEDYYADGFKEFADEVDEAQRITPCASSDEQDMGSILAGYSKINYNRDHGTLEFRQHSGTTDFRKILGWLLLTDAVINRSLRRGKTGQKGNVTKGGKTTDNFAQFIDKYEIRKLEGGELKRYLKARAEYLAEPYGERGDFNFQWNIDVGARAADEEELAEEGAAA